VKFRKGSKYHQVSDCGRYSVAKVIVLDQVQYEAWHTPDARGVIALGVRQSSSLDCIGICRRHNERASQSA
jgi:hypothetical protein